MTENEFRDALKKSVGHTGLSSDRQAKVLAGRKGEKRTVRTSYKMKIALVIAAAMLLGATGAVASGLGGVNWDGKPVQYNEYKSITATEKGARLDALYNVPEDAIVAVAVNLNAREGEAGGILGTTSDYFASSLEEMQVWVEADGTLDWVKALPRGYELKLGRVGYACGKQGGMELLSHETTDDGYMLTQFLIPEECRFMSNYFIRLINAAEDEVTISVRMDAVDVKNKVFRAGDDAEVTLLSVAGMDHALAIDNGEKVQLALHQAYAVPVYHYYMGIGRSGQWYDHVGHYKGLTIEITATDARLTAADLLAIFGLTAE